MRSVLFNDMVGNTINNVVGKNIYDMFGGNILLHAFYVLGLFAGHFASA